MMQRAINSRADLESLRGTAAFADVLDSLLGSTQTKVDTAEYPEGYGTPEYEGPHVDPVWSTQEDLTTLNNFGMTKQELLDEIEGLQA